MKKIYRKLTKDQEKRGVVFSSSLSRNKQEGATVHEVKAGESDFEGKVKRLKDDGFFDGTQFVYNIIIS